MTATELIDLLESVGYEPQSYSGRCMYGLKCVGVTIRQNDSLALGAEIAAEAIAVVSEEYGEIAIAVKTVIDLMRQARQDDMGRDIIIYWPNIEWPKEDR